MKIPRPNILEEEREQYNKLFEFSGSTVEGAMMARCFQLKQDWKEVELGIMMNLFTIPQEVSHLLEPVEDKPGFVCLHYITLRFVHFCQELLPDIYTKNAEDLPQYISPFMIKDHMVNEASEMNLNLLNTQRSSSKTETTIQLKLDHKFYSTNDCFLHTSIDFVPAVRLLFLPDQATTWITRQCLWPQQDTIQSIVDKGCHVVPRSSPGGDGHSEWRLSFSGPEAILAQFRSKEQQQAYYFVKMFF